MSLCSFIPQISVSCLPCVQCCAKYRANSRTYPCRAHNPLGRLMRKWTMTKQGCIRFHEGGQHRMIRRGASHDRTWGPEKASRRKETWFIARSSMDHCGNPRAVLPGRDSGRNTHMTWWDFGYFWVDPELTVFHPYYGATVWSLEAPHLLSEADRLASSRRPQACFS